MITAILTTCVVWSLFFGRVPAQALILSSAGLGVALAVLGRHRHSQFLTIDVLAQTSRLNSVNPALKFWTALGLMILCVSSRGTSLGLFLTVASLILTVIIGGLPLRFYVRMLALPVSFLLLGALALLYEVSAVRSGVFALNAFGVWLCVSEAGQLRAMLVIARALGALSCLYTMSLSTPMSELIGVLRRARCPAIIIELMYLIYRYIFILLGMYHSMRDAAASRLGYMGLSASLRTTGNLYSNLLSRSYRQASRNFDAMESRCYDAEIRFLERWERVTATQVAAAIAVVALALILFPN